MSVQTAENQFLVLTTVSDRLLADQMCSVLEDADIPVLLEHVELFEGEEVAFGIRVMVPAPHAQRALGMVDAVTSQFESGPSGLDVLH